MSSLNFDRISNARSAYDSVRQRASSSADDARIFGRQIQAAVFRETAEQDVGKRVALAGCRRRASRGSS